MKSTQCRFTLAFITGLSLAFTSVASAYTTTVDDVTWSYTVKNDSATIISNSTYQSYTNLTIPPELDGYPVTGIGSNAFRKCRSLASVTIPGSITNIGLHAFLECWDLTSVYIHDLTAWYGISFENYSANPLWYAKHLFLDGDEVTELTIPEGVTQIGSCAFYGGRALTSVTIPKSVTNIGSAAFYECSGLTAVHIHDLAAWCAKTFEDIYANPLYYAHHLFLDGKEVTDSLVIPDCVTHIEDYAFAGCSGLTSVTIPESVTSIGKGAFSGCSGLVAVHIHDLTAWCAGSFSSGFSIDHHLFLDGHEVTNLVVPEGVTTIGDGTFSRCINLFSVTIPDSVTSIGEYAFYSCRGLTNVVIPDSVTSIGYCAFDGCSGLTNVTIPDSVTSIGDSAFFGCSGLTSVTIPESVASIGWYAFGGCTGLTSLTIPDSVMSIGGSAFSGCSNLTSVTIPDSVTNIGEYAFSGCSGLTSVTM